MSSIIVTCCQATKLSCSRFYSKAVHSLEGGEGVYLKTVVILHSLLNELDWPGKSHLRTVGSSTVFTL